MDSVRSIMLHKGSLPKVLAAFLFLVQFSIVTYLFLLSQTETIHSAPNLRDFRSTKTELIHKNDQHQSAPVPIPRMTQSCEMDTCFDFSRCSLHSGFPVYFYTPQELSVVSAQFFVSSVENSWSWKLYRTQDAERACVFVLVIASETKTDQLSADQLDAFLRSLPHWSKGNHVLISLAQLVDILSVVIPAVTDNTVSDRQPRTGQVVLAQPSFPSSHFRRNYDIVIPLGSGPASSGDVWSQLRPLYPAQRKYLVSFWGEYIRAPKTGDDNRDTQTDASIVSALKRVERAVTENGAEASITLSCAGSPSQGSLPSEWALCGTGEDRRQLLSQSTFTLLFLPPMEGRGPVTSSSFLWRLREALHQGAVPVLLGDRHAQHALPFSEALHWLGASLSLPLPRVTDLPHVLASIPDSQVLEWRRQGRWLWQTYFSSDANIVDATLAVMRSRLMIPPATILDYPATILPLKETACNDTDASNTTESPVVLPAVPMKSPRFQTNFTFNAELKSWNSPGGSPLFLLPSTPFEPVLPSDAKFKGQRTGSNEVFSTVLGGNAPEEMFTVMMLTYKRQTALMAALGRLRGTPFLHKVIVVWNDPDPPSPTLSWPDIGVPVVVVRGKENTLNNRFLPYDVVETDCVFSLDDDLDLSQHSILLGFRIWRSERERIVGFLTRYHRWDYKQGQWLYTTGKAPDEMSITTTGVTFFHRYYLYLYSYLMPQAIRDHVTKKMNCEDIAMNFLIAHVTRKPPIRVNSTMKRHCPKCPKPLSMASDHLKERHECVESFSKIYGYMPLLFTPFSAGPLPPYL